MLLNGQTRESKVDPRVKRTRKLLQTAFKELLAEQDFHAITVQDIAGRAEVNRATFYAHFEDKYALMAFSVREALQEELDRHIPENSEFSLANLKILIITVTTFLSQFLGHCHPGGQTYEQIQIVEHVQKHIYEVLLNWLASSPRNVPEEDAIQAAVAVSWMIFGSAFQANITKDKRTPAQVAESLLAFVEPGLQAFLPRSDTSS